MNLKQILLYFSSATHFTWQHFLAVLILKWQSNGWFTILLVSVTVYITVAEYVFISYASMVREDHFNHTFFLLFILLYYVLQFWFLLHLLAKNIFCYHCHSSLHTPFFQAVVIKITWKELLYNLWNKWKTWERE